MIGSAKPRSRSCPVVLDPTVAASFVGLLGGRSAPTPSSAAARRFAERLGEEVAGEAFVLHDDGLDPGGFATAPFDAEGVPRAAHAADRGRAPADLPPRLLHGPPRRRRLDRQRGALRLPLAAASRPRTWSSPPAGLASSELLREAGDGVYVNDVAGLHSGVNPVTGVFSVGASGRAIRGGELAEPLREFTIASDLVSMLRAVARGRIGVALGALRRLGQRAAAADRRDDGQRLLRRRQARILRRSALLDCRPTSTTDGGAST